MKRTALAINLLLAAAVSVGNYFYLTVGGLTLKALCSSGFALIGLVNLVYALKRRGNVRFSAVLVGGLVLAMLGDIALNLDFFAGAALFAAGHICYFVAQSLLMRIKKLDLIVGGVLMAGAGLFILFCPLLSFPESMMKWVCLAYALIISLMVGKSISNFIRERNAVTAVLMAGCVLFFVSDLMLVVDWFMGGGKVAGYICMATYYPAECLLAHSVFRETERQM